MINKRVHCCVVSCCLFLASCLIVSIASVEAAVPNVPQAELRIGYQPFSSPTGAIFEVVKRDRILRQELARQHITLTFVPALKGKDSELLFKRGELDAIAMGDMPMITFAAETPVVIIGRVRQGFSTVVAPRGTMAKDLKGKRIGNVFASSAHYALLKTLQNAGLTERDVTLVPLEITEMPKAILDGRIDAFSAWEPNASLFIAQYPDRFSSAGRQSGSGYLSIPRKFVRKHPAAVSPLAASLARAMQWLRQGNVNLQQAADWNRDAMQKLTGKVSSVSIEELSRQIGEDLQDVHYSATLPPLRERGKNLLFDEFRFLQSIGKLPKTAQWDSIRTSFDHSIMERIYRNPKASLLNRYDYEFH